jgi:hypothetical protein
MACSRKSSALDMLTGGDGTTLAQRSLVSAQLSCRGSGRRCVVVEAFSATNRRTARSAL